MMASRVRSLFPPRAPGAEVVLADRAEGPLDVAHVRAVEHRGPSGWGVIDLGLVADEKTARVVGARRRQATEQGAQGREQGAQSREMARAKLVVAWTPLFDHGDLSRREA